MKKTTYLFAILAVFYTAYFAKTLILPILIALFLSMSVVPIMAMLQKCKLGKSVSAILILFSLMTLFTLTVLTISEPLQAWIEKLPQASAAISKQISEPLNQIAPSSQGEQKVSTQILAKAQTSVISFIASSTPSLLAQILATLVLTYFFLTYGEDILRKTVSIRNTFTEKKLTVEIVRSIQTDISYYLFVISTINRLLGCFVGITFYLLGIQDPILWGVLAMCFNFVPYLGPTAMALILLSVGFIEYDTVLAILTPALAYLTINLIEANFVTPTILGKKLKLNPLVLLVWLFIWGWIWETAGFFLGVPMLVCFKIIAQGTDLFGGWIQLIEENDSEK